MTEHIRVPTPGFGQESKTPRPADLQPADFINPNRNLNDPVNHPQHYTDHPSGVECITVTEHMNFNLGNAMKYIWRFGSKGSKIEDLLKAAWYINREIERLNYYA